MAKVAFLIRARSGGSSPPRPTIQITPVNTRPFSLSPSWGILLKKPICQLFANFWGFRTMPISVPGHGAVLTERLLPVNGMVSARGPGLGLDWDEHAVARYAFS